MGKFHEDLLNNKLHHPTQRKFTLEWLTEVFTQYTDNDTDDIRLYEASQWVFKKLDNVRLNISNIDFSSMRKEDLVASYFGFVNRDVNILLEMQENIEIKDGEFIEDVLQQRYKFHEIGPAVSMADKFEGTIEALKYPLLQCFHSEKYANKKAKQIDDSKILADMQRIINNGQFYLVIEKIWGDCLYKGYSIEKCNGYDRVKPPIEKNSMIDAIATFRIDSLVMQNMNYAKLIWKNTLPEQIKRELINFKVIKEIVGSGKSKKYVIKEYKYDEEIPPQAYILDLLSRELYYTQLIDEPLPNLEGIILRKLIHVWHLLYSLGDVTKKRLPTDTEVKTIGKLKQFSTKIKIQDLATLISSVISVTRTDSMRIIEFLTYSGNNEDELWIKPFYKVDDDLYFSCGTLMFPNLLRSIEHWMKNGGIELSDKGPLFEIYIKKEIDGAIKKSSMIKNAGVFLEKLIIKKDDIKEEIDLVIWIGSKIIIGELKCVLYPTSPLEEYRYHNRLIEAKDQIKRKKIFVENNLETFLTKISLRDKINIEEIKIIPFVLTNLLIGGGKDIDGIPVIDLLLLNKYLRDGEMPLLVVIDKDGGEKAQHRHKFYENEQEAIDKLEEYIRNPSLINLYLNMIDFSKYDYPALKSEDKPFIKYELFVNPHKKEIA
ncbi:MAG: hypothetical protein FD122_1647 [Stygiobacter sp.]|nr:MAG: hypothetical protein FD122_1647 [Stygiobacter sp.]KAF0216602.1 MAG: hypothetical protein FD178_1066 [Ignavibacteria bacterium]